MTAAITDQDKHAAKVLKDKGNNYYLRDEFQQAINSYNQSLEYDTSDAVIIHSNKSVCYLRLKKFEQALNEANRAIQLDPKATKAWYYRAQALEQTSGENGWREAEKSYEKALVVGKEKQNAKKNWNGTTKANSQWIAESAQKNVATRSTTRGSIKRTSGSVCE